MDQCSLYPFIIHLCKILFFVLVYVFVCAFGNNLLSMLRGTADYKKHGVKTSTLEIVVTNS